MHDRPLFFGKVGKVSVGERDDSVVVFAEDYEFDDEQSGSFCLRSACDLQIGSANCEREAQVRCQPHRYLL
jgi:hypothetical protein